jgi:HK97 gp10 family phage protein
VSRDNVLINWNGDEVVKRAKRLIGKSAWTIGLAVLSDAKALCPVDTGYLAASLMAASSYQDKGFGESSAGIKGKRPARYQHIQQPSPFEERADVLVGTAVEYGPHVEFGTIRSSAQPFLRPALDMARGKVPTIVQVGARQEFAEYMNVKSVYSQTNEAFSE